MKKIYYQYHEWECFKNGMYRTVEKSEEEKFIKFAEQCLKDPENSMISVLLKWPKTTEENLTDKSQNRKSWLGQAACCIYAGVPEYCTRSAWNKLTKEEQNNANNIAKEIIEIWESYYLENQY